MVHAHRAIFAVLAAILLSMLLPAAPASAQGATKLVRTGFAAAYVDLVPFLGAVETDKKQASVQVPSTTAGATEAMQLQATGDGPKHRWAIFTAINEAVEPVELVIDASRQSFPGSGIFRPTYLSSRIAAATASTGPRLARVNVPDRDAFALTIPPRSSLSVALELSELGVNGIRLWKRSAFDANMSRQSLYRGVVIGMATLSVLVITCLVVLSPQIVFPLSAVFAWAAVGFITLEIGLLRPALSRLMPVPGDEVLSAIVEALMAAGVLLMGVTIMRTRRQMPLLSVLLVAAGGACLGLAAYSWFEPLVVKQIVRPVFAASVAIVLLTAASLVMRGGVRARSSILVWLMLGAWTIAAGYIALQRPPSELASPLLVGGLAIVLVALAFVLTYFAFSSVLNPELDALEAERNALALAGGEQVVWDYQPGDGSFHVGEQLEGLLGYEAGSLSNTSLQAWINLLHPNDMPAFNAMLEMARSRANQRFEQQLRFRHADGRYRWYSLKGRSLTNAAETGLRLSGLLTDASQERQSQERMLSDAIYDVVTGLPNYALYMDRLGQAVARAGAAGDARLAVMIVDLDRFRVVNSRLGQEIGDSLLKAIARRIEALLPDTSSMGRLPGDQFAIIYEINEADAAGEDLIVFVDKVRQAVSSPVRVPPNEIFLTCCMGVVEWDPRMESAISLHQYAEVALFDAKKRGKDHVSFYKPGMQSDPDQAGGLSVEDLQSALQEQRLELLYQPIMRMADRQLAGFEALVRLRRRDGVLLEPSGFVPLAERCGLIGDIGAYVLSEAARQLGVWQRMFTPAQPVFVSVNISSAQLAGGRLLHLARTILQREELAPGSLKLELTETMVMENPELSLQVLERLKALGLGLSCDDFGTGYSSLSYLRRLPFDTLKVDRSFLLAGLEDERGSVVLDAIILLAHDLGLQVVCEGVETDAQMNHLASLECDLVQGFLIGEPIDAQQVLEALGAPTRGAEGTESGIAALWNRLSRRKPQAAPPVVVPVPEPEPEEEQLAPWSPYDFHPAPWAPRIAKKRLEEPVSQPAMAEPPELEAGPEPDPEAGVPEANLPQADGHVVAGQSTAPEADSTETAEAEAGSVATPVVDTDEAADVPAAGSDAIAAVDALAAEPVHEADKGEQPGELADDKAAADTTSDDASEDKPDSKDKSESKSRAKPRKASTAKPAAKKAAKKQPARKRRRRRSPKKKPAETAAKA
jgi:diguanylate cyclase (GGDEF)-like protein